MTVTAKGQLPNIFHHLSLIQAKPHFSLLDPQSPNSFYKKFDADIDKAAKILELYKQYILKTELTVLEQGGLLVGMELIADKLLAYSDHPQYVDKINKVANPIKEFIADVKAEIYPQNQKRTQSTFWIHLDLD